MMTANEFVALCEKYTVPPSLALENDRIRTALAQQDDAEVKQALQEDY